ncbi:MAG: hypothetical protein KF809_10240 [Chloroflexi bacterium]|nr:hypothetical protein [Chloroflexota bacterium]
MNAPGGTRLLRTAVLAALVGSTSGMVVPVHAQDATPMTVATRFRLPDPGELADDARRTLVDVPVAPDGDIDLSPILDGIDAEIAALDPRDWEVAALAGTLSTVDDAFALVRDGTRFDAYAGLLRGAEGTLSARAGNSFDRAALLKALLDAQRITTRYAFGTLDADTAAALVARSFAPATTTLPGWPQSPVTDDVEASIEARARRDHALLTAALADHLAALTADTIDRARTDLLRHAWVQVQQTDGSWLDLDPSLPGAQPGETLTVAESTANEIAASDMPSIGIRVLAEHLVGGSLSESVVLDESLPAWALARQQVLLAFVPEGSGGGLLGGGGLWGGGGDTGWVPTLIINSGSIQGDSFIVSGEVGGGGLLGPGEQADLTRLSLEITTLDADGQSRIARQVIADRLTADQRASGSVTADALVPLVDIEEVPTILRAVLHLMVSTGSSDPLQTAQDTAFATAMAAWGANDPAGAADVDIDDSFAPAALADRLLVLASEQRFIPAIDDDQVRAYVSAPRVTVVTRSVDVADPTQALFQTDLVVDGIRTLAADGAPADAAVRRQLWYGALQGAAETEYQLASAALLDPVGRTIDSVSFDMLQPLTVLADTTTALPGSADGSLGAILAAGGRAVVPGPVADADSWWEIAADGTTRAVLAPRLGGGIGKGAPVDSPAYRVQPLDKEQPTKGDKDKGDGGNEYLVVNKNVAEKTIPTASRAGHSTKSTFDTAADALAKWKRFNGG